MFDRRDTAQGWWSAIDAKKMTAQCTVYLEDDGEEERTVRIKFAVCDLCNGRGTHVNPSIDAEGLSREDFDNDPEFAEDYFSGKFDVPCRLCDGARVVPVCLDPETEQLIADFAAGMAQHWADVASERRMGA